MAKKNFTERWLSALKPQERDFTQSEGQGFTIRVLPTGLKTFWFYYTFAGARRKLNLGVYPEISLAAARDKHAQARLLVSQGIDPAEPPPEPIPEPEALILQSLAEQWLEQWSKLNHTPRVHYNNRKALEAGVLPLYGHRLAAEIRRRDAIAILEDKAKDTPGQAVNLHKALRGMFQYAVARELLEFNPFAEIRTTKSIPAMKQESRERILSDAEINYLWLAIDEGGGSDSTKRALKVMLLTGQRSGEVCGMQSTEIQIGVAKPWCHKCRGCGWWTIPKERRLGNKGGEHLVYLSRQALKIIGERNGFIFPGDSSESPITVNAVNYHVRRKVESTGKKPHYGLERWTPHDLRRTCGTGIRRLGASRDTMDLILGHRVSGVTGVYDRYQGESEKQDWLTKWAEHLQQFIAT
jgi:integrase